MIRPQYHFRKVGGDTLIWDVRKLNDLAATLPVQHWPLDSIAEIDEPYWGDADSPLTCRDVLKHADLIASADLSFPIILCADGRIMDGMHRVLRAVQNDQPTIRARVFDVTPGPDFKNISPSDLAY